MDLLPLLAVALSAGSAALFFLVGRTVARREVSAEGRSAQSAFVAWWICIGSVSAVSAIEGLPGFPRDLLLFLGLTFVLVAVLCVGLAGLIHYLVVLYTNRNLLPFIVAGYAAFLVLLVAFLALSGPDGVESTRWGPRLHLAHPTDSGPLFVSVVVLLVAPPVVSAGAYLRLYRIVQDPMLKRRILLVSLSIMVWFGSALVGVTPAATDSDWWRVASRLIGLAAATVILYAYAGLKPSAPQSYSPTPGESDETLYEAPRRGASQVVRASLPS